MSSRKPHINHVSYRQLAESSEQGRIRTLDEFMQDNVPRQKELIKLCARAMYASRLAVINQNDDALRSQELPTDITNTGSLERYYETEVVPLRRNRDACGEYLKRLDKDNDESNSLSAEFDEVRNNLALTLSPELREAIEQFNREYPQQQIAIHEDEIEGKKSYTISRSPNNYVHDINECFQEEGRSPNYLCMQENGAKTRDSVQRKLRTKKLTLSDIADLNRVRIVVDSDEMAQKLCDYFSERGPMSTEGWTVNKRGLMDMKVCMLLDDRVCEVQILPRSMAEIDRTSHRVYELMRDMSKKIGNETVIHGDNFSNATLERMKETYNWLTKYLSHNAAERAPLSPKEIGDFKGLKLFYRYRELEAAAKQIHLDAAEKMPDDLQAVYQALEHNVQPPKVSAKR
ncbi:MAG: hypothetical protein SFT92_06160 [Rickettsiales bacterium]|nr:hypothetical protein [Rickettsiales bacterium]